MCRGNRLYYLHYIKNRQEIIENEEKSMEQDDPVRTPERRGFFISYTRSDQQWAEWIAMQLEQAGYTLFIQAWDFRPGSNFVAEMDKATKCAERTLLVLSPAYLVSDYAFTEWAVAFRHDPKGAQKQLLPVRIQPCEVEGLLGPVVYIDLVQLDEKQARERLLAGVHQERAKPATVAFPGPHISHESPTHIAFPGTVPTLWNIPYSRNPIFTGREQLLTHLADTLMTGGVVALTPPQVQAISGLGGIGKTQLAIEYAYRHRQDYQAIFWTRADTTDAVIDGYGEIAHLLQLPEQQSYNHLLVVKAVQEWFRTQTRWLLILDNVDDLTLARTYLPSTFGGHILLTTRAQSMGTLAEGIEVHTLDVGTGALLLLRRVGLLAADALSETALPSDLALASAITEEVGGLPLALDQAGAYIEETGCSLADYQHYYRRRRTALLKRRGGLSVDHPEPITTTWSLSFEKVEQVNFAAAELLRLCAFLHPDSIPEEIIIYGAAHLGPVLAPLVNDPLALNEAIALLRAYGLIRRDSMAKVLRVHRLVQAVLQDTMDDQVRRQWVERAVLMVNEALHYIDFSTWEHCHNSPEYSISHAQVSTIWIGPEGLHMSDAAAELLQFVSW
jgi:hypothetical protein